MLYIKNKNIEIYVKSKSNIWLIYKGKYIENILGIKEAKELKITYEQIYDKIYSILNTENKIFEERAKKETKRLFKIKTKKFIYFLIAYLSISAMTMLILKVVNNFYISIFIQGIILIMGICILSNIAFSERINRRKTIDKIKEEFDKTEITKENIEKIIYSDQKEGRSGIILTGEEKLIRLGKDINIYEEIEKRYKISGTFEEIHNLKEYFDESKRYIEKIQNKSENENLIDDENLEKFIEKIAIKYFNIPPKEAIEYIIDGKISAFVFGKYVDANAIENLINGERLLNKTLYFNIRNANNTNEEEIFLVIVKYLGEYFIIESKYNRLEEEIKYISEAKDICFAEILSELYENETEKEKIEEMINTNNDIDIIDTIYDIYPEKLEIIENIKFFLPNAKHRDFDYIYEVLPSKQENAEEIIKNPELIKLINEKIKEKNIKIYEIIYKDNEDFGYDVIILKGKEKYYFYEVEA